MVLATVLGCVACAGTTPHGTAAASPLSNVTGATPVPGAGGFSPCVLLSPARAVSLGVAQPGVDRGPAENTSEACLYTGDTATLGVISDAALALGSDPLGESEQAFLETEIARSASRNSALSFASVSGIGDFAVTATGPDGSRFISAVGFVKSGVGIDVFTINPNEVALGVVENVAREIAAQV